MECNRQDALKALELAEKKFNSNDIEGAKRLAQKARTMFRDLPGLRQTLAAYDVHLAASKKSSSSGGINWHSVLGVNPKADLRRLREQFRKMSILTHPDKNPSAAADGAFKLIMEAWTKLSNAARRDDGGGANANDAKNNGGSKAKGGGKRREEEEEEAAEESICPACNNYGCEFLDNERTIKKCECCELVVLLAKNVNLRVEGRGSVKLTTEKVQIGVRNADEIEINGGSCVKFSARKAGN
ncbi:hypothetical protein Cni_G16780 [Canna indica]|uniref:J domain-containing protein n=1 Tax=Canna indica TaxID=4628 RepID=A0AAQ3KFR2_9LILI|nr:hypothetical protein Cni_G16780 [Canna indica]